MAKCPMCNEEQDKGFWGCDCGMAVCDKCNEVNYFERCKKLESALEGCLKQMEHDSDWAVTLSAYQAGIEALNEGKEQK